MGRVLAAYKPRRASVTMTTRDPNMEASTRMILDVLYEASDMPVEELSTIIEACDVFPDQSIPGNVLVVDDKTWIAFKMNSAGLRECTYHVRRNKKMLVPTGTIGAFDNIIIKPGVEDVAIIGGDAHVGSITIYPRYEQSVRCAWVGNTIVISR